MFESPRTRRLRSDLNALTALAADSSIFSFSPHGTPPDFYILRFRGHGIWKRSHDGQAMIRDEHEVHVRLGASYPRMMPDIAWKSPIFHPNISSGGVVCLGGYGTHWAPSLALDELCSMLWDMIRFANFDESSPYNREAAAWAKNQTTFHLPIDPRPLRDKAAACRRGEMAPHSPQLPAKNENATAEAVLAEIVPPPIVLLGEVVEAEMVLSGGSARPDILFID
jgi:ubiquitin-protein ligase